MMHLMPVIRDGSHALGPLRGQPSSMGTYGMSREMLSCSEVKEAVSPVLAQSASLWRSLEKSM